MKIIKLLCSAAVLLITVLLIVDVSAQNSSKNNTSEFDERDEISQTFNLAPGSRVKVSTIRGSVVIETADTEVAEIHIVRLAQSRSDLEKHKISIENSPQSLIVRGEQEQQRNSGEDFGPDVRHQVMLKLPRRVNLSINRIGGDVQIGNVDGDITAENIGGSLRAENIDGKTQIGVVSGELSIGQITGQTEIKNVSRDVKIFRMNNSISISTVSGNVQIGDVGGQLTANNIGGSLNAGDVNERTLINVVTGDVNLGRINKQIEVKNISGNVRIGRTDDSINLSVITGTVSVGIATLGGHGIEISNISGKVELRFIGETNAQLTANNITGNFSVEIPSVIVQSRPNAYAIRALIGKGGTPISINVVTNDVRLVRDK